MLYDFNWFVFILDFVNCIFDLNFICNYLVLVGLLVIGFLDLKVMLFDLIMFGVEVYVQILEIIFGQSYFICLNYVLGVELVIGGVIFLFVIVFVFILGVIFVFVLGMVVFVVVFGGSWYLFME